MYCVQVSRDRCDKNVVSASAADRRTILVSRSFHNSDHFHGPRARLPGRKPRPSAAQEQVQLVGARGTLQSEKFWTEKVGRRGSRGIFSTAHPALIVSRYLFVHVSAPGGPFHILTRKLLAKWAFSATRSVESNLHMCVGGGGVGATHSVVYYSVWLLLSLCKSLIR